jgi:hypothetical protein
LYTPHRAQPVPVLGGNLVHQRRNHAAGAAPGRPEVHLGGGGTVAYSEVR